MRVGPLELALWVPISALALPWVAGWAALGPLGLRRAERTGLALPVGILVLALAALALTRAPAPLVALLTTLALAAAWGAGERGRARWTRPALPLLLLGAGTFAALWGIAAATPVPSAVGYSYYDWLRHYEVAAYLHAAGLGPVPPARAELLERTPGYNLYSAALLRLWGPSFAVHQAANAAAAAAGPGLAWLLARRVAGRDAARLAALLVLASSAFLWDAAIFHWSKPLAALLLLGGLLAWLDLRRAGRRARPAGRRAVLAGALLGGAAFVHPSALFLAPPLAVDAWLFAAPRPWKARHLALAAATAALPLVLWVGWLAADGALTRSAASTGGLVRGETGWEVRTGVAVWNLAGATSPVLQVRALGALVPEAPTWYRAFASAALGQVPYGVLALLALTGARRWPRERSGQLLLVAAGLVVALVAWQALAPLPALDPGYNVVREAPAGWAWGLALAGPLLGVAATLRAPAALRPLLGVALGGALLAVSGLKHPNWSGQLVNAGGSFVLVLLLLVAASVALPRRWRPAAAGLALLEVACGAGLPLLAIARDGYLAQVPPSMDNAALEARAGVTLLREALPAPVWLSAAACGLAAWLGLAGWLVPRGGRAGR